MTRPTVRSAATTRCGSPAISPRRTLRRSACFLLGDAAASAHSGQKVPQGYYNVADMLSGLMRRSGIVSVCGTCMDARGIRDEELVQGAARGTMDQLAEWSAWADKVLVF